ncbi:hypothetical protein [Streptomyces sp. MUM 178J]|uniref:hypothetical protein n=1 Tax=Streptomyces sp. MUM 178J TaxID=2791991 RepID=UPI001F047E4F|nr:hypothetical protein [Streptomyces sp. MUM 178J]WRQ80421.1 hypothetical protein I3F59_014285 [Streptomyces sp. MUM 178J]
MDGHQDELRAVWALLSKPRGDGGEYRVLACSEGRSAHGMFDDLVRRTLFGTPPQWADGGAPGEGLPWISFGAFGESDLPRRHISISITHWSGPSEAYCDSSGRRIAATRFFAVPYEELARTGIGLTGLWHAVRPVELPPDDGQCRLALPTGHDPLPEVAELLDGEPGFDWAAATAATALERPLALVSRSSRFAMTRLATIDAVAWLLPYGCRAGLTAATWASEPGPYTPWLCYTHSDPADERVRVLESEPPEVSSRTGRAHLARLRLLRQELGTLGMLRELAADKRPARLGGRTRHGAPGSAARGRGR